MVIDASIGVKWVVPEEDSAAAIELLREDNILVPPLFHAEVGNALWKKAKRSEIEIAPVMASFAALPDLVQTVSEVPFLGRALEMAAELDHPIYDCVYLAMAERMDDRLVTVDARLLKRLASTPYAARVKQL